MLDLLVEGRTNPEIGALLGMTLDGAKWHVSQLLLETSLESRLELADWWVREREKRLQRVPVLVALSGFALRSAPYAAVVFGVSVIVGISLLAAGAGGEGRAAGSGASIAATRDAFAVAPLAVSPFPTPTATPVPPGAWVFDVRARSASPVPELVCCRQWLDPAASTFLAPTGSSYVVLDASGQTIDQAGQAASGAVSVVRALQDSGSMLVWRPLSGTLSAYEAGGAERTIADFGRAPANDRPWDISPRARKIALGESSGDRIEVAVYNLDGTDRRVVYSGTEDAWVAYLDWSPDGRRLLIRLGLGRGTPPRVLSPSAIMVVDAFGVVSLRQQASSGGYRWAGNGWLLVQEPGAGAYYIDVLTGAPSPAADAAGLLCVSPDGRYGIVQTGHPQSVGITGDYRHRLVDLASQAVLAEVQTSQAYSACDWTWDSTRAVVSPGGK